MEENQQKTRKFDYSWVIIIICFLSVCISLGFCSSNRTMYLTAITDALGIPRGAFSLNDTFRYAATTVINLFFGLFINKFGAKKLLCAGFLCLIGFAVINSLATELYLFYVAGILLGIGLSWTGTTMVSVVISRWCTKNKGAITGAVLAANGLGGALAAQIISPIIFQEGNPFGYQDSYRLVALILAVMLVLILVFFREKPKGATVEDLPLRKKRKVRGTGWVGMEYKEAIRKPYFYVSLLCMFLIGISLQGFTGISTPHMYDLGFDKQFVANLTTISSLCLLGSKFLVGFMYDRFGIRITMNISFFSAFISLAGLILLSNTPTGHTIASVRIVFQAIALPLETVMLPLFASELFGNKCFDKTVGIFVASCALGLGLGAPLANLCFDIFGNYNLPFIIFAVIMIFVTVAMQIVVSLARRDKKKILQLEAEKELAQNN